MKNLKRTEGFTLVELMIVLSIIAILAVVLVPKVGNMKDSVREQGVYSNINSVRAYLELKISNKDTNENTEATNLIAAFTSEFGEGNAITNPFTNGDDIGVYNNGGNQSSGDYSVLIHGWSGNDVSDTDGTNAHSALHPTRKGKVIILVADDGYSIFGYDSDGKATPYQIVK